MSSSNERLCACHGLVMQTNGPRRWRCAVRRRERDNTSVQTRASRVARQRRFYHEKRKFNPQYKLVQQLWAMTRVRY